MPTSWPTSVRSVSSSKVRIDDARDPEVEHARLAAFVDEDVGRLQVAVHDPLLMGVVHRVGHLGDQLQALTNVERLLARVVVDRSAAHQLHREEGHGHAADRGRAHLVDLGDPRMLQPPEQLGLVAKAMEAVAGGQRAEHLESDASIRPLLLRLVDDAHPAAAQHVQDRVVADALGPGVRRRLADQPHAPQHVEPLADEVRGVGVLAQHLVHRARPPPLVQLEADRDQVLEVGWIRGPLHGRETILGDPAPLLVLEQPAPAPEYSLRFPEQDLALLGCQRRDTGRVLDGRRLEEAHWPRETGKR